MGCQLNVSSVVTTNVTGGELFLRVIGEITVCSRRECLVIVAFLTPTRRRRKVELT